MTKYVGKQPTTRQELPCGNPVNTAILLSLFAVLFGAGAFFGVGLSMLNGQQKTDKAIRAAMIRAEIHDSEHYASKGE